MRQPGKEKGEHMRKDIARRCLCIALASAMVFGDVGIASAAESNSGDVKGVVSAEADNGDADVAAITPYVNGFEVRENYGGTIYVNVSVYAYKAELWINGKKYENKSSWDDNQYIGFYENINALPGTTYTVEIRYNNKDGEVFKTQKKVTTSTVTLPKTQNGGESAITAQCESYNTDDTGINKPSGIRVTTKVDNPKDYTYKYEVYRSSKPSGGYSRVYSGYSSDTWDIQYFDTNLKLGSAYYYKVRILRGTDDYVTSDKVLSISDAAGARYGVPECSVQAYSNGEKGGSKPLVSLFINSNFANQYDIYRSTNQAKGYKKIATIYSNSYSDKSLKKGTVYYYKAVPKYYDSKTGKTATGKFSEPVAVRYLMDTSGPTLTQVAKTSMKCEWSTDNSSDVSYEIWYRRTDLSGDAYRKAAVTKKKSFVLKNLAADGTYSVKIRTVKKAGSTVKYAEAIEGIRTMGYTTRIQDLTSTPIKSAADTKKGVVAVYYKMTWYKDWGASGYYIKAYNRYTKKIETIKKLSAKATSYTFRNVADKTKGLKYGSIDVIPYRGKVMGDNGDEYSCLENDTLPSVSKVKVVRKSGTSVQISWTAVPGAKTYVVRRTTALGVSQIIGETSSTSFVDTHVTNGLEYVYMVSPSESIAGFNGGYENGYIAYTHVLTRPAISSGTNSAAGTASLKWGKIANAKCYKVYRAESVNGKYVQVAKTSQNVMVYADKKLKKGKTYYYKVVALTVNGCGKVVKSNPSAAKAVKINK